MSAGACETWIWGNRLQAAIGAAMDLLQGGEIDRESKAGAAWLGELNSTLGASTKTIEDLLANLPAST